MKLFDLHCDTLTVAMDNGHQLRENDLQLSFEKGKKYSPWIQTMAVFIPDELRGESAKHYFDNAYSFMAQQLELNRDVLLCRTPIDVKNAKENSRMAVQLAVEGGAVFAGKLETVEELAKLGVRMVTLTWNGANEIGGGVGEPGGLTAFGREAVKEMERLDMTVDISHASVELAKDVFEISEKPIVASHSNCASLCSHPRNLHDWQINEIIRRKGLIGINLYPEFVTGQEDASMDDIYRHIDRILSLGGESVIAMGTDFDGAPMPSEIADIGRLEAFYEHLLRRNLKESTADAIFFGNAYKFFAKL